MLHYKLYMSKKFCLPCVHTLKFNSVLNGQTNTLTNLYKVQPFERLILVDFIPKIRIPKGLWYRYTGLSAHYIC